MDFIVDAMLGRLATWLRLTGNDTIYSADIEDEELLNRAENEGRVLLTADNELCKLAEKKGIECMLLQGSVHERLAEVFHEYGIEPNVNPSQSRCSKCNGILREINAEEKEEIKDMVFEQTYDYYDRFWLCEDCNSVYFQGGYWTNIQKYMHKIQEILENDFANHAVVARQNGHPESN